MAADPLEDPDARLKGIEARYEVNKIHDPTGKHKGCKYFVLDPEHDPIAPLALASYSSEARRQGFTALANDLDIWLAEVRSHDEIDQQIETAKRAAQAGADLNQILADRRAAIEKLR